MRASAIHLVALLLLPSSLLHAAPGPVVNVPGPAGSAAFGENLTMLSNGNMVVVDTGFDSGASTDVGAVHLVSPNGIILSTLRGSTSNDRIGSAGITVLENSSSSSFLVRSPLWNNGGVFDAGAVTLVNGATGVTGVVSASNSIVGSTNADKVGQDEPRELSSSFYLVIATDWDNGSSVNAGAVRLCSSSTPPTGPFSASNALVGSSSSDRIGSGGVVNVGDDRLLLRSPGWNGGRGAITEFTPFLLGEGAVGSDNSMVGTTVGDNIALKVIGLGNGSFVIASHLWDNGTAADAGCVRLVPRTTQVVGSISSINSLVGATAGDHLGEDLLLLTNGFVVSAPSYDTPGVPNRGAVTWCSRETPRTGFLASADCVIGAAANDSFGAQLCDLANGNYVVGGPQANGGAGIATWLPGDTATTGVASIVNSTVGGTAGDNVGGEIVALPNGHYVLVSPNWDNASQTDVGAVTWRRGDRPSAGLVSAANSVIGAGSSDSVGSDGVDVVGGSNFIVRSSNFSGLGFGAVTWANGALGLPVGQVTERNSLVGGNFNDHVGQEVVVLSNGNYVVLCPAFNGSKGSLTWGGGGAGVVGFIGAGNSLLGQRAGDFTQMYVTEVQSDHYVLAVPNWANGSATAAGAAMRIDSTRPVTGFISADNALVGVNTNDRVGHSVTSMTGGGYIVASEATDAPATDAGAISIVGGAGLTGNVSATNSILGANASDFIGSRFPSRFSDGTVVQVIPKWDNGPAANAGAVFCSFGSVAVLGPLTSANLVEGGLANSGANLEANYVPSRRMLVVGRPSENIISLRRENNAGRVGFASTLQSVAEEGGTATVELRRSGGVEGPLSVSVRTNVGTATAGVDYTALPPTAVDFASGQATATVSIPILLDGAAGESNETFFVDVSGEASNIGPITRLTVRILETSDNTPPTAPVISAPLAAARIPLASGAALTLRGTASDNKGIARVQVSLNGGPFDSVQETPSGKTATWTASVVPVGGPNRVEVRAIDTRGNVGPVSTRSFVVTRPLFVQSAGSTTPGVFTAGFAPSSFREIGAPLAITATPPAGFLFSFWSVTGSTTLDAIGLAPDKMIQPTVTFTFREGMILTANFVANPFSAPVIGNYNAIVTASPFAPDRFPKGSNNGEDGTAPSLETEGCLSLSLTSTGAFTARLKIGGLSLPFSGLLHPLGGAGIGFAEARFGVTRANYIALARPNGTPLHVRLTLNLSTLTLTGIVEEVDIAASSLTGNRAHFGAGNPVPASLLGSANSKGVFNCTLTPRPAVSQPSGLDQHRFPQGNGFATVTLSPAGAITVAGSLPDGTAFTGSTVLFENLRWNFFVPLYANRGFLIAQPVFDPTDFNTDLTAINISWIRPILDDQHYPHGWPGGLVLDSVGTKLTVTAGESVLPGLGAIDGDGNADLVFDGSFSLLPAPLDKAVGITTTDTVQKPLPADPHFTLALTRASGKFSGSIKLSDGTSPRFNGVILQKGVNRMGFGFFKTVTPAVKDYTGQVGSVRLVRQ